jgi:ankyrin repeat protein
VGLPSGKLCNARSDYTLTLTLLRILQPIYFLLATVSVNPACDGEPMLSPDELHAHDPDGLTLLHQAARDGRPSRIESLLRQGASLDSRDKNGRAPLHWAAMRGQTDAASVLIGHGSDPNARADYGMTPLHWAALRGETRMVELLLARGALAQSKNIFGMTPLFEASAPGVVKALMAAGAQVDESDQFGMTPLHWAHSEQVARAFIQAGGNPFAPARNGALPAHMAMARESALGPILAYVTRDYAHVRDGVATITVLLRNIGEQAVSQVSLGTDSQHITVRAAPASLSPLSPAQLAAMVVTLSPVSTLETELEDVGLLVIDDRGKARVRLSLRLDGRPFTTPEDRGMIRVAKVNVRSPPGWRRYLAYGAGPLVLAGIWLFVLVRRRMFFFGRGRGVGR